MADRRPNILLITGDEWRADSLGCSGNQIVKTPHIDALSSQGLRFSNGYCPAPMCVPSRISLLTGQTARVHGCLTNGVTPTDNTTFAELLRASGYDTGAFGKMHFVPVYHDLGFDTMQIAEQHGDGWRIDDYHRWLWENYGMVDWVDLWDQAQSFRENAPEWYHTSYGAVKSQIPEEAYHTNWITDKFIEHLGRRDSDDPFFSWVSYIKPHHPFDPPGKYAEMYDPKDMPLPPKDDLSTKPLVDGWDPKINHFDISEWTSEDIQRMTALYYGNITLIDDCVGRIVTALEEQGVADNTVIIVTSDHGDYLGHHGFITKAPFHLYEDNIRVPFIVWDGRKQMKTGVSEAFVNLIDLFPTLMSLTVTKHSHRIHGNNLMPILTGEKESVSDIVVSETPWSEIAIRKGPWKLIQYAKKDVCELYNVEEDPFELQNRYPEMKGSDTVADLRDEALRYLLRTTWDRYVRDTDAVFEVVDKEAKELGIEKLDVDPTAWKTMWPESDR